MFFLGVFATGRAGGAGGGGGGGGGVGLGFLAVAGLGEGAGKGSSGGRGACGVADLGFFAVAGLGGGAGSGAGAGALPAGAGPPGALEGATGGPNFTTGQGLRFFPSPFQLRVIVRRHSGQTWVLPTDEGSMLIRSPQRQEMSKGFCRDGFKNPMDRPPWRKVYLTGGVIIQNVSCKCSSWPRCWFPNPDPRTGPSGAEGTNAISCPGRRGFPWNSARGG